MLVNRYVLGALSLVVAVLGAMAAFDWTSLVSAKEAGTIVAVIGLVKLILAALMPAPGQVVGATGKFLITHRTA